MNDPESTAGVDGTDAEWVPVTEMKTCANCGTIVDEYDWFPIRGRTDEDGEFQIYSFCSEECVEAWEDP